jgi:RNA polymerase sigma factor (sigma-70 family)
LSDNHRLSRIETLWSVVQRAHEPDSAETAAARASLLDRYGDAVRRYLMASLRDADAVDDAFQEFSLRFVRGDFANVSPEKGRFRNYLKTVVYHLIADFGRARKKFQAVVIEHESMLVAPEDDQAQALDAQFLTSWRESLLHQAWERLREEESASGKPWYTVLRSRAEHPEARSNELSEIVKDHLGRTVSPGNIRVLLHRARDRFAEILSADVRESLANADADRLRTELQDLNLWTYCRHLHESSPEANP